MIHIKNLLMAFALVVLASCFGGMNVKYKTDNAAKILQNKSNKYVLSLKATPYTENSMFLEKKGYLKQTEIQELLTTKITQMLRKEGILAVTDKQKKEAIRIDVDFYYNRGLTFFKNLKNEKFKYEIKEYKNNVLLVEFASRNLATYHSILEIPKNQDGYYKMERTYNETIAKNIFEAIRKLSS